MIVAAVAAVVAVVAAVVAIIVAAVVAAAAATTAAVATAVATVAVSRRRSVCARWSPRTTWRPCRRSWRRPSSGRRRQTSRSRSSGSLK